MNNITVTDTNTGEETVCCLMHASDMIGVERTELYRKLKESPIFIHRHFSINSKVTIIEHRSKKPKKRTLSRR